MSTISRDHLPAGDDTGLFAITASAGTTAIIPFEGVAGGRVYIPTSSPITTLTFHDAPNSAGTFLPSYDDTATTPVAITLTGLQGGRSYPIPAKMFGAGAIKMVGNDAGNVYVSRKS